MKLIWRLLGESFLFAWQALVVNKLRTMLSLLGVTIGIFSIIFVLSVVDSMEADMKQSLNMIGSDILFIQKWPMGPEEGAEEYEWWKYMKRRQPSMADMDKLRLRLDGASFLAFQTSTPATVEFNSSFVKDINVTGITCDYSEVMPLTLSNGRYFSRMECDGAAPVAIIGHSVAEGLFGNQTAVGKEIKLGGLRVTIIGVLQKEGASLFGTGLDLSAFVPVGFGTRLVDPDDVESSIIIKAANGVSNKELRDETVAVFREVRGVKPSGDNDFSIIESSMISSIVDSIVSVFNIAGVVIGVFAILVGAFSIANIMFVSVRERTNIIGIQKSLGAKNYFVLMQFLFESIALCVIGGLVGLLFVWLTNKGLTAAFELNFILPMNRILMGIGISVAVGVVAGIVPALGAARMNPVDAMRSK
jgi:putative ABC transport system permease protein